ncbi:MAG: glucose 1-dehydrogenase [Bacillota bacterium]|nr:glucose 1-dehydrogenase [Bacillota bacterium]
MAQLQVNLAGKVALVTGGSKGIGKACAEGLADSGAFVAIAGRTKEPLEETKAQIIANGGKCEYFLCDVSKKADIDRMVAEVLEWQNHIDILINSAGINIQQKAEEVTEEAWDAIINTNTKGAFFCSQAVGKKMIEQQKGKIINISSTMGSVGFFRRSAYCASKGAVNQFTKVLAVEWAPHNITVNNVAPTFIRTPFTEPMFKEPGFLNEVVSRIPMGRVGEPEEVVGAVLYLASDSADFTTGQTILVDGGWVAW